MVLAGYGCISCIIDDVVGALLPLIDDEQKRQEVIRACLRYLEEEFSTDRVPSEYITGVHRILKKITGITVPFAELRQRCNEIGRELAHRVSNEIETLDEEHQFKTLLRWAIAGNELDFRTVGTGYELTTEDIYRRLEQCVEAPLAVDDMSEIYRILKNARQVLYIPDNVGEIAFDLLVVKQLRAWGSEVYFPLRGGPITSDATMQDGQFFEADSIASEVFEAGPDTLGILLPEASERLLELLYDVDVILTKGQANFYTFSEYKDKFPGTVISLLRTKCDWATSYFGISGKVNIATILKSAEKSGGV